MSQERIGRVMVDSGQVMVGDPCYLKDWKDEGFNPSGPNDKYPGPYAYDYDGACRATCSANQAGELEQGLAVAVSSGYGDGTYPVYIERDRNGRVASMHVYFDVDPNEDEDDSCDGCGRSHDECSCAEEFECDECGSDSLEECGDGCANQ